MNRIALSIIIALFLALPQTSCMFYSLKANQSDQVVPAEGYGSLDKFPFKEAWYGTYFQEDKIGCSHFKIEPTGSNFTITNDSTMRLKTMKETNEIVMKEIATVRPDMTMVSFQSNHRQNDKNLKITGRTEGGRLVVTRTTGGEALNTEHPFEDKVYHFSARSFMPALKGLEDGKAYSFIEFDPNLQRTRKVDQQVSSVKGDPGPNGAMWKVTTSDGRSVVHEWLDRKGLAVLQKAVNGDLVTVLEDENAAKKFLQAKTTGKDLILDVSFIPVSPKLPNPERLQSLKLRMQGIDPGLIARDWRQVILPVSTATSSEGFDVAVRTEDLKRFKSAEPTESRDPSLEKYLGSTLAIQSDHNEIVAQARKVVDRNEGTLDKVIKLVRWTAENVENKMQRSFTALEVLHSKTGECQSHATLYTALARAEKIPSRVATGLVYTDRGGFLYHAWAESYVNGWLAVDPTLKQVPADATHIKIAAEQEGDEAASILKMLGKVKIELLEYN
ncbi:MAG: transglutaminase domain-containing protein [Desulfomonile tiedjei]|nr:transglutaminase domain-containing protein [Desulfomonile tiedjei]